VGGVGDPLAKRGGKPVFKGSDEVVSGVRIRLYRLVEGRGKAGEGGGGRGDDSCIKRAVRTCGAVLAATNDLACNDRHSQAEEADAHQAPKEAQGVRVDIR
jgi:hypothetical protein